LGFKLTKSQTVVLQQMRKDMSGQHPMRRLLQGDVGSGKTVVAACCALMAIESGYDVALMAPTEILAEQHFANFSKWLQPLGIAVALRTGSRSEEVESTMTEMTNRFAVTHPRSLALKTRQPQNLETGAHNSETRDRLPTFTVGTHALIESGFNPEELG